MRRRQ